MPFVKKNEPKGSQAQPTTNDIRKIFVGRQHELHFFTDELLKPEDPIYNIISIYGDGGVGKSTLLTRFMEETRSGTYKDYCLSAIVDERQVTAANMMEKFTEQLHMQGDFRKALARYKEALRKQQDDEDTMQDEVLQRMPDFTGAIVEGVPVFGPILRESLKATTAHVVGGLRNEQARREIKRLEDPIGDLTRAFVTELNQLADSQVPLRA
ncbi:MAG TPA: ATP-binding protein, partial [Ktedonobacteraceae bacterium]|nr:ATP-binding protein [Ktedonobacteraceae bacterium]